MLSAPTATAVAWMALVACAGGPAPADCDAKIRKDGVEYTGVAGIDVSRPGRKLGSVEQASCGDNGKGPGGSQFGGGTTAVDAWVVRGYDPGDVVAVRLGTDTWQLFIADLVPTEERSAIVADLE